MRDGALAQRNAAGEIDHVVDVRRAHNPLVERGDVLIQVVLIHVLQIMGADQAVVGHAGDGEYRRLVDFGVVEPVQQVDRARGGGGEADPEPSSELGKSAGGHGGRFLMTHVDIADLVAMRAERLHEAVNAIAGQAEDGADAPIEQALNNCIGNCGHW